LNLVVGHTETPGEATVERGEQVDEWLLLLPDGQSMATVVAGGAKVEVTGKSLIVVPAGPSSITLRGRRMLRAYTARSTDLLAVAANASSYDAARPLVRPLSEQPPASAGRVLVYSLDTPRRQGPPGRIWRSGELMLSYIDPLIGPRDPKAMTPHSHADFEQITVAIDGEYIHHIRWPWGRDLSLWRADEHERCVAPSAAVIPAQAVHTSQAMSPGLNQLIDIWCPARADFLEQPGWVLNADAYPPASAAG
jgi:hypothetical protein